MSSLRAFLSNPDNKGRDGCFRCLLILRVVNRFSSVAPLIVSLSHEEDIFKVVGVASLEDSFLLEGRLFFFGKLMAGFRGGLGLCQLLSSEQPASAQQSGNNNNNSNCTHQIHIVFIFSTYSYSIIILIFVLIHHECILIVLIQIIIAKLVIVGITLFFGSTFYCGVIDLFFFGGLLPPPFSLPGRFLHFWVVVVEFFFFFNEYFFVVVQIAGVPEVYVFAAHHLYVDGMYSLSQQWWVLWMGERGMLGRMICLHKRDYNYTHNRTMALDGQEDVVLQQ